MFLDIFPLKSPLQKAEASQSRNRENKHCSELLLTNGMGLDRAPIEFKKLDFWNPQIQGCFKSAFSSWVSQGGIWVEAGWSHLAFWHNPKWRDFLTWFLSKLQIIKTSQCKFSKNEEVTPFLDALASLEKTDWLTHLSSYFGLAGNPFKQTSLKWTNVANCSKMLHSSKQLIWSPKLTCIAVVQVFPIDSAFSSWFSGLLGMFGDKLKVALFDSSTSSSSALFA